MNTASEDPSAASPMPFRVVVLSGPSGSGKTTIVNQLIRLSPIPLVKAISATTRPPRKGERHGEDYYFLTHEEFLARKTAGEFVETAEVYGAGYWYGTLLSEIDRARQLNSWSFLEIDVEGALRVMQLFPDAITIFLKTPSPDVFEHRLRGRGTDSEETIQRRLKQAHHELAQADKYRHQVVNDDLDSAVTRIISLLEHEVTACSKN
ncbi:MAG: guanylate kinase [Planctomyces sp.]|nr:guanylate kinase [Planctomyces sp.]